MSTLHGRTRVNPNGDLLIALPRELNGQVVEYTLIVEPAPDAAAPTSPKPSMTQAEWRAHIDRFAGSCPDFPDIERPGPESFEQRIPFD